MQERLERGPLYPWRVLVACALLNRTGRAQVRPMFEELFRRWPTPRSMAAAGADLEEFVRPLGLWRRRSSLLRRMSGDLLEGKPIESIAGVGQYARDAYRIFVEGRNDVEPEDKMLRPYLTWRRRRRGRSAAVQKVRPLRSRVRGREGRPARTNQGGNDG